jgi:hypothetical protein
VNAANFSLKTIFVLAPVYSDESLQANLAGLGLSSPISTIRQNKKARLVWFPPTNLLPEEFGLVSDLAHLFYCPIESLGTSCHAARISILTCGYSFCA